MQWFGIALEDRKVYYTTQENSFKIPFVRKLIKLLRAIPIPTENKNKPYFIKALDGILKDGDIIQFYPEASLWPYYNRIRNFKTGAFHFAVRNDVPIIPMVFTFRNPKGIRKILKKKLDVTLTILEPIKSDEHDEMKQSIDRLKNSVYKAMEEEILRKEGEKSVR